MLTEDLFKRSWIDAQVDDQEMYDSATLLGMDAEMTNVEFAVVAQANVVVANEGRGHSHVPAWGHLRLAR